MNAPTRDPAPPPSELHGAFAAPALTRPVLNITEPLSSEEVEIEHPAQPISQFRDNAKEAMEFYQPVFGGELTSNTFAEFQASDDSTPILASPVRPRVCPDGPA